jgi:hypothetical protein
MGEATDKGEFRSSLVRDLLDRLALLQAPRPRRAGRAAILALVGLFAAVLLACMVETIAHTSCCFNFPSLDNANSARKLPRPMYIVSTHSLMSAPPPLREEGVVLTD